MTFHEYAALPFTEYERARLTTARDAFREGVAAAAAQDVAVVIFFVPMKFRVYGDWCEFSPDSPCRAWRPWALPEAFADTCVEAGLDCVDLTTPMRQAAAAGRLLYAPEDSHWNEAGHAFVAEQVEAAWRRLGLDSH